jgi:hypothetical protein
MRVVLGLKQLLGEKWYRKSISTLSRRKPTNGLIEILVNSVCRIVKPDPDDEKSVSIYAILTNETKEQARARMLKSGLGQSKR